MKDNREIECNDGVTVVPPSLQPAPVVARHAIERARERYGIDVSPAELAAAEARIRRGECLVLGHDRGQRIVVVRLAGVLVTVVAKDDRGSIVTVLPGPRRRGMHPGGRRAAAHMARRRRDKKSGLSRGSGRR